MGSTPDTAAEDPGAFMSIAAVAAFIEVDPRTVRQMIADGRLKAYRLGWRVIRLRRSEVEAAFEPIDDGAA